MTCLLHQADGERCNKSLTLGQVFSEAEATHRIKEWCARGYLIADVVGGKSDHMRHNPREFRAAEIRPLDAVEHLVNT